MNRTELTVAIAVALVAAALLGWILHWIFGRLSAGGAPDARHAGDLAIRLHAAEEAHRSSERRLAEVEAATAARLSSVQAELAAALDSLAKARFQADEIRAAYRKAIGERHP